MDRQEGFSCLFCVNIRRRPPARAVRLRPVTIKDDDKDIERERTMKNKSLLVIFLAAIAAAAAFTGVGVMLAGQQSRAFAGDGYILASEEAAKTSGEEETQTEPELLYFSTGTRYRSQFPDSAVFTDVQGSRQAVQHTSFVHYADESVSSLSDGVAVNMDDIGMGIVNHYGVSAGVVMMANGDGYTVENNGSQVNFRNMLWKLSDTALMLHSAPLTLHLPDGTSQTVDGYLEARYIEDGIVRLTEQTRQWQVVAEGTEAVFANGIVYDFGSQIVKDAQGVNRMTLQEVLLDADDNIQVQSAEEWVAPEFDFEVVDGQDGQSGEDGETGTDGAAGEDGERGEDGESGEDGEDGEDGSDGSEGSTGSSGRSGAAGINAAPGSAGNAGTVIDKTTDAQAAFHITEFDMTAGSLSVVFDVVDDDGVLTEETGSIQLLDPNGNAIEWESTDLSPDDNENSALSFFGDSQYTITWNSLNPDTEYRLVVTSGYTLKDVNGKRDYINRTFYTDSSGIQLERYYTTEDSFGIRLTRKEFSQVQTLTLTISDAAGNLLLEKRISADEFANSSVVREGSPGDLDLAPTRRSSALSTPVLSKRFAM